MPKLVIKRKTESKPVTLKLSVLIPWICVALLAAYILWLELMPKPASIQTSCFNTPAPIEHQCALPSKFQPPANTPISPAALTNNTSVNTTASPISAIPPADLPKNDIPQAETATAIPNAKAVPTKAIKANKAITHNKADSKANKAEAPTNKNQESEASNTVSSLKATNKTMKENAKSMSNNKAIAANKEVTNLNNNTNDDNAINPNVPSKKEQQDFQVIEQSLGIPLQP